MYLNVQGSYLEQYIYLEEEEEESILMRERARADEVFYY